MITIDNENFVEAVASHPESKLKIAVKADSSINTLEKLINGDTDLQLSSVEKLADYVGFDVQVQFVKRPEQNGGN